MKVKKSGQHVHLGSRRHSVPESPPYALWVDPASASGPKIAACPPSLSGLPVRRLDTSAAPPAIADAEPGCAVVGVVDQATLEAFRPCLDALRRVPTVAVLAARDEALELELIRAGVQETTLIRDLAADLELAIARAVERHTSTRRVYSMENRLTDILEASEEAVVVVDAHDTIRFANAAAAHLFGDGGTTGDVVGRNLSIAPLADGGSHIELTWDHGAGAIRLDARVHDFEWRNRPAHLLMLRDVTRQKREMGALKARAEGLRAERDILEDRAHHDALTGLLNRHGAQRVLSAMDVALLAVLFVDCDDFKAINDRHGHSAGDAFLRALANRMRDTVRAADAVVRLGGDEFLLLLPDTRMQSAEATAERIRAIAALPVSTGATGPVTGTVSIGVVGVAPESRKIDDIVRAAEHALKAGKRQGKNQVQSGGMDS